MALTLPVIDMPAHPTVDARWQRGDSHIASIHDWQAAGLSVLASTAATSAPTYSQGVDQPPRSDTGSEAALTLFR